MRLRTRLGFKFRWDYYATYEEAESERAQHAADGYRATPVYKADGEWVVHWRDYSRTG